MGWSDPVPELDWRWAGEKRECGMRSDEVQARRDQRHSTLTFNIFLLPTICVAFFFLLKSIWRKYAFAWGYQCSSRFSRHVFWLSDLFNLLRQRLVKLAIKYVYFFYHFLSDRLHGRFFQVGEAFWEMLLAEHGIDNTGVRQHACSSHNNDTYLYLSSDLSYL